ncbi:LysR family transcriptional regulator [Pseudoalteromonas sp. SR44-5]|uniref:LysR family transcriptional regulator n=1 Tax=unclassified Pseudoalteromonas TaxID=194690 RepID=UPI0015FED797|nr:MULTISPECIES: LysR family transcriptional regulator [unclassified Pseudoalteromonas]MBB1332144.1 LysR family transcriptional regulator [Pseudoalteromonas sp. SR41-6]MBB1340373.1 LysR family transcriptional regulator [Pseudoalteromonas sp. SR45-6]MBB1365309.1 LysR family transcriptional regulator [Pseudoalteromonas sp. SR44-5]MBB1416867.1 LysR family transcriptional regulator [Pseudoalteromonas sp. SG44-1]MBB1421460.1 LysR family transcriptional regulator [Pseudoalteromonas sp. SG43-7]
MINPTWLHTFCTLVEVNHFTQTAERLYMTQSGVSQHIKKLEQQVNCALLERHGKQFTLTAQGQGLYQKGSQLLKEWQFLEQQLHDDSPYSGNIKIQSPGSCGLKFYNQLLDLQGQHKALTIDYRFAPNESVEQAVANHNADIGFLTQAPTLSEVTSHKIGQDALLLITPIDYQTPSWQNLCELGFIAHPDAKHHAQLLLSENYAEFEHLEQIKRSGFSNQINLILEPVSLGLGFTVLPAHAVSAFSKPQLINVHPLQHPISESIYVCYHRNRPLAKRMSKVIEVIKAGL